MPRESGSSNAAQGGYSDKYMSTHARLNGHPETAYNKTPESEGVWASIKKAVGWQDRYGTGPVGGSAGMANSLKKGVLK